MRTVSVQEFHDHVAKFLRGKEPFVVTRYGKEPLGIYYPAGMKNTPKEIRWAIFEAVTQDIGRQLKQKGVSEDDIVRDFKEWRKNYGKNSR